MWRQTSSFTRISAISLATVMALANSAAMAQQRHGGGGSAHAVQAEPERGRIPAHFDKRN